MKMNCEYVRDVYPDMLADTAPCDVGKDVWAHVASCEECRAEIALLDAIHAQSISAPAGLHERIVNSAMRPARQRRLSRSDIAMAATLAAALIGGSIIMRYNDSRVQPSADITARSGGFGFVGVEDAMLSGKTSLDDLSVEELEKLLGEMES